MYSVTQRIKQITQPRGGYLKPKDFSVTVLDDKVTLNPLENIHPTLMGLVVDYLTRYATGAPLKKAFFISLLGAECIDQMDIAKELLEEITGLDDSSIRNACKLTGYDVCCRAGVEKYYPIERINPDSDTIYNIKTMVHRSVSFMNQYGPVIRDGFTFTGGYTALVSSGDGDFLTEDTLWDFKVSKYKPTCAHTLQLLIYYLMGKHSIYPEFQDIEQIGIFNPRLNYVYQLKVSQISADVIQTVSKDVIGYS